MASALAVVGSPGVEVGDHVVGAVRHLQGGSVDIVVNGEQDSAR
ncbi:MAG TPA: hypothetical protein VF070_23925 [Streptosporangiaceae bacterium]